jgi:hypothetical protein
MPGTNTFRVRNACVTWNNYPSDYLPKLQLLGTTYFVYGKEICPTTGTPHLQLYLEFSGPRSVAALQKILEVKLHFDARKGTSHQAAGYCKKANAEKPDQGYGYFFKTPDPHWDGEEFGECSNSGERVDLNEIAERVKTGDVTVEQILEENPLAYHQYGRTLDKLEDIQLRKKFRTEMTECIWYYGPTGVGKSHTAFNDFDDSTHYNLTLSDGGWWDGYKGQHTVILNDFRGELPYNLMLNMIDKWPFKVKRRGREPMSFLSKKVIITSSQTPAEVFNRRNESDKIEQLLRRIQVVEIKTIGDSEEPPADFGAQFLSEVPFGQGF